MRLEPLCRLSMRYTEGAWIRPFGTVERAILTRVELLSDDERYRWLNTTFIVGEGEIDEETEAWWVQAYACINEVVEHPPAIGSAPPEGFRQADR